MTDRDSTKDISSEVLGLPVISKEEITITSGALKPGRRVTLKYYGDIPLTNGSQIVVNTEHGKFRAVIGHNVRPNEKYATVGSRVGYRSLQ